MRKVCDLKYGENPDQKPAWFESDETDDRLALDKFELIDGAGPGFVNLTDMDRALRTTTAIAASGIINECDWPVIAAGFKHGNACGAAVGREPCAVIHDMTKGDALSLFGAYVMMNFAVTTAEAEHLRVWPNKKPAECKFDGLIAPRFGREVPELLRRKDGGTNFFVNPALAVLTVGTLDSAPLVRPVRGGRLIQPNHTSVLSLADPEIEYAGGPLTIAERNDAAFAVAICRTSDSNTSTIVKCGMLQANAVRQQSRVGSAELADTIARRSRHDMAGSVVCTDGFYVAPDAPLVHIKAGVSVIIAPRGGRRLEEIKKIILDAGRKFVIIPQRLFYGH